MGQYFTSFTIEFEKPTDITPLLKLMDKEDAFDDFEVSEKEYNIYDVFENALFGKLEERDGRFIPDFDLTNAPLLIAALWPDSVFDYSAEWEYSVGGGITFLDAKYRNGKLYVKDCQTDDDLEDLDEEVVEAYDEGELDTIELIDFILLRKEPTEMEPVIDEDYVNSFASMEEINELSKMR